MTVIKTKTYAIHSCKTGPAGRRAGSTLAGAVAAAIRTERTEQPMGGCSVVGAGVEEETLLPRVGNSLAGTGWEPLSVELRALGAEERRVEARGMRLTPEAERELRAAERELVADALDMESDDPRIDEILEGVGLALEAVRD